MKMDYFARIEFHDLAEKIVLKVKVKANFRENCPNADPYTDP